MTKLGTALASALAPGSVVLLKGPVGAGKTHLARAVISAHLRKPEDIPSPTFTLIQTYEGKAGELWHADLYRLADTSELVELGLDEAIGNSIVLIEWPDRLPPEMVPDTAISVNIEIEGDERRVTVADPNGSVTNVLARLADA